jgi:prophage regulatory protein
MSDRPALPRIIRLPEVIHRTGLSQAAVYREMAKGKFPQSVPLTDSRSRGWCERKITEWIERRLKSADTLVRTAQ